MDREISHIVGKNVKQLRQMKFALKQKDLAEKLEISSSHLLLIEKGKILPSSELTQKICNALHVSINTLFETHEEVLLQEFDRQHIIDSLKDDQKMALDTILKAFQSQNNISQGFPSTPESSIPETPKS